MLNESSLNTCLNISYKFEILRNQQNVLVSNKTRGWACICQKQKHFALTKVASTRYFNAEFLKYYGEML